VVNATKSGDHYWVIAHVTPSVEGGKIVGYHSTRRVPNPNTIQNTIIPLYDELNAIEKNNASKKDGLQESVDALHKKLGAQGVSYDEFVSKLMRDD